MVHITQLLHKKFAHNLPNLVFTIFSGCPVYNLNIMVVIRRVMMMVMTSETTWFNIYLL